MVTTGTITLCPPSGQPSICPPRQDNDRGEEYQVDKDTDGIERNGQDRPDGYQCESDRYGDFHGRVTLPGLTDLHSWPWVLWIKKCSGVVSYE